MCYSLPKNEHKSDFSIISSVVNCYLNTENSVISEGFRIEIFEYIKK
jgi:hypothetical protein